MFDIVTLFKNKILRGFPPTITRLEENMWKAFKEIRAIIIRLGSKYFSSSISEYENIWKNKWGIKL